MRARPVFQPRADEPQSPGGRCGQDTHGADFTPFGFTLVEVLVAMVLTAMVITLLSSAMRFGLLSWRKLGPENHADILAYAVPVSLERYLEWAATEATVWRGRPGYVFPLCGTAHGLAFYSTYGPPGSDRQGLRLIGYLYDASRHVLEVYDVDLVEKEGEVTDWVRLAEELVHGAHDAGPPLSRYGNVTAFELAYAETDPSDSTREAIGWKDRWTCEENLKLPRRVRLIFGVGTGSSKKVSSWVFSTEVP
ncbi:PulJ/GspJ family protein [Desulfosoma caldarium]|uniref:Prepilin-type N-terminal cleavage/methylation domain-containing protein n=1 Tax=Desulfosoma caldarium TaxID=610254 RepID=A0A3N1VTL9_9BACT|nr:prepilin-type N-terminal cleavage/methylation domain-containing protein [Desulfosoma caldarium]ROR03137.1 prepilin-type N-terminal cleavage/methylation domain-containing protein [Desulfosoma caldarium]